MIADIDRSSCPLKPVDTLTDDEWKKAWQFTRKRYSKFIKEMYDWGLLRDIETTAQLPVPTPSWIDAMRVSLKIKLKRLECLPNATSDPQFDQRIIGQYEQFKDRNTSNSHAASSLDADQCPASMPHNDADARFDVLETPLTKMKDLIQHIERAVIHGENRAQITLTREQVLACVTFATMVHTAWTEERQGILPEKRSCQQLIILGQGGTGKTFLVTDIFIPLVNWAFPADVDGERWLVVAFSHAQANAISTESIRARTLHNACAMRVQSLANKNMAPGAKKDTLLRTWRNKVLVVNEEVSMMPAEAINMEMYRSMWGRHEQFSVNPDQYAELPCLFGRMPLAVFLGDFLQLKPPKSISLADDLIARARQGHTVSVEAQAACHAFQSITNVIELVETRRFKDKLLPEVMDFLRSADSTPMDKKMWSSLQSRAFELNKGQLDEELFANGHIVGIFWENIARSIVERATRDAKRLNVPLIFCRACDQRPVHQRWGSQTKTERDIVHQLLTTVNMHKTGHLHGILPLHAGMRVRLTTKISAVDGLVNERCGTVQKIDLHDDDTGKLTDHFARIRLDYMPRGAWILFDSFHSAPLEEFTNNLASVDTDSQNSIDADGLVYIKLEKADFNISVYLPDNSNESIHVTRWNLPLTHAMVRTAMSSQGLTFNGGVLADLRRNGGMENDVWWLNVYVMLSRARKLENLILIGLTPQIKSLLEAGPPAYIRQKIQTLQAKSIITVRHAERLAIEMNLHIPAATMA